MAKRKTETDKKPNSIFRKLEINSISDIFQLYLYHDITQEAINNIAVECGNFLYLKKEIPADIVRDVFSFTFNFTDNDHILVLGSNLLSSLWIIGVYPENPEKLINKTLYNDGDFNYRFYTKNKNLSITKTKLKNERKLTSNP